MYTISDGGIVKAKSVEIISRPLSGLPMWTSIPSAMVNAKHTYVWFVWEDGTESGLEWPEGEDTPEDGNKYDYHSVYTKIGSTDAKSRSNKTKNEAKEWCAEWSDRVEYYWRGNAMNDNNKKNCHGFAKALYDYMKI
eukprot:NODE_8981_length_630_cov_25.743590_g8353_i0.p1 GENE.NODE_8981_length_630_cov_25.743590_g8353_i0~~NODE_8981_length_630_cov_25.743590_g8353_i0.p1  ORF type:complete len:137 (+),score=24.60 NODE_8981_length_630_cov_25.743590_g8353_i0:58-468(+)